MSKVIRLSDEALLYLDSFRIERIKQLKLLEENVSLPGNFDLFISQLEKMSEPELLVSALEYACHQLTMDISDLAPADPELARGCKRK